MWPACDETLLFCTFQVKPRNPPEPITAEYATGTLKWELFGVWIYFLFSTMSCSCVLKMDHHCRILSNDFKLPISGCWLGRKLSLPWYSWCSCLRPWQGCVCVCSMDVQLHRPLQPSLLHGLHHLHVDGYMLRHQLWLDKDISPPRNKSSKTFHTVLAECCD